MLSPASRSRPDASTRRSSSASSNAGSNARPDTSQSSIHPEHAYAKEPTGGTSSTSTNALAKKRGAIACRRCRRLRTKCITSGNADVRPTKHDGNPSASNGGNSRAPCDACLAAGVAGECSFPRRGEKDVDRQFRRRPASVYALQKQAAGVVAVSQPGAVPGLEVLAAGQGFGTLGVAPGATVTANHHAAGANSAGLGAAHGMMARSAIPSSMDMTAMQVEDALPPHDEIVHGCKTYLTSYFQLGFTPKSIFIEGLVGQRSPSSTFLLTCILSVSARFTPPLVRRYGSANRATAHFLGLARAMALTEMYRPSLERTQAFFLLAISEWGNGDKDRSSMDMGVAVRMAALLKLHREETYRLPADAPAEHIVRAESARRTFWMIQSQENLHSGYSTPAPFPLDDITAYLPCDEVDFAFGIVPTQRAALDGTPPAQARPDLAASPSRCLFATLVQAHNLWGRVARRACRPEPRVGDAGFDAFAAAPPWDPTSEFARLAASLREWEEGIPLRHRWSVWNLRGWRAESLHLAYLAVVMVLRLSNIVVRRIYLDDLIAALAPPAAGVAAAAAGPAAHPHPPAPAPSTTDAPPGFWTNMAHVLFANVLELHEQIDAYFAMRSKEEGFPAILVFCVYICGSLASYLWRYPWLCRHMASEAEDIALKSLQVLTELHGAWPTSARWQQGLQKIATPMSAADSPATSRAGSGITTASSMAEGEPEGGQEEKHLAGGMLHSRVGEREDTRDAQYTSVPMHAMHGSVHDGGGNGGVMEANFGVQMDEFPSELFDAELTSFLTGSFHYGLQED